MNAGLTPRRVDIGVCTFKRTELAETIASLGRLQLPEDVAVRIIVADNDEWPSAKPRVDALAAACPHEIVYVHAPMRNISLARNACLDHATGDFLAFIDDDEVASTQWLAELLAVAEASGAEAVLGPVRADYRPGAPEWMKRGDFHSTFPVWVKGEIVTGYTCNVLVRLDAPSVAGRRFDLALGRSGGEDTAYFTRLTKSGGRIAYAPEAWTSETVPDPRATLFWLGKRKFRMGQTHGRLVAEQARGMARIRQICLAASKAGYCMAAAAGLAAAPRMRNRYALRGLLHAGAVSGLLGVREIRQYGGIDPSEGERHPA
ncbi:glycosyltransferase [Consotaella aegiceratis]|uniref:glycosyltransferase n=1 Tax=Consotaella aegiceratis TaxID=3097961 RepID=UPI002F425D93